MAGLLGCIVGIQLLEVAELRIMSSISSLCRAKLAGSAGLFSAGSKKWRFLAKVKAQKLAQLFLALGPKREQDFVKTTNPYPNFCYNNK